MQKYLIIVLVFTFSISIAGQAQQDKSNQHKLENMRMAYKLIKYGYEKKNPISLIAAIDVLIKQKIANLKLRPNDVNMVYSQTNNYEYLTDVLSYAKSQAGNNISLLNLINKYEKELFLMKTSRGAIGGARVGNHTITAKGTNYFWVVFKENELAEISVIGIGDNVLEVFIYDERNQLIDKDNKRKSECYLNWIPKEKKAYKIKIKNYGDTNLNYSISTN